MQNLLNNWNLMRVLRLAMGLFAVYQAIELKDVLFGLIGALFLYQAWANVSCFGVGACNTPLKTEAKQNAVENTSYEEVK